MHVRRMGLVTVSMRRAAHHTSGSIDYPGSSYHAFPDIIETSGFDQIQELVLQLHPLVEGGRAWAAAAAWGDLRWRQGLGVVRIYTLSVDRRARIYIRADRSTLVEFLIGIAFVQTLDSAHVRLVVGGLPTQGLRLQKYSEQ